MIKPVLDSATDNIITNSSSRLFASFQMPQLVLEEGVSLWLIVEKYLSVIPTIGGSGFHLPNEYPSAV